MKEVLFVGDRPGNRNTDLSIAFEGTLSGKRLDKWIRYMGIKSFTKVNFFNKDGTVNPVSLGFINYSNAMNYPIVALGNNASKALDKLGIHNFKLPHPSGRNRVINHEVAIRFYLDVCKSYIEQEK